MSPPLLGLALLVCRWALWDYQRIGLRPWHRVWTPDRWDAALAPAG